MSPHRRRQRAVILAVAAALLGAIVATGAAAAGATVLSASQAEALAYHAEARLLEAHRELRDAHRGNGLGLAVQTPMTDMRDLAREWSANMAGEETLAHNPDTASRLCCYRTAGENVGRATGASDRWRVDDLVDEMMRSFLASPTHAVNLVAPDANEIGVGVVVDPHGHLYATVYVRERLGGESTSGAPYDPGSLYEAAATLLEADPIPPPPLVARSIESTCDGSGRGRFHDVADGPHLAAIECVAAMGLMQGTTDTSFAPTRRVTRGQAATTAVRLLDLLDVLPAPSGTDHFDDDDASPHEGAVNLLADLGLLTGEDALQERPATRSDVARYLATALIDAGVGVDVSVLPDYFSDDATDAEWAFDLLGHLGVVIGDGVGHADPDAWITRAQAASAVARAVAAAASAR